MFYDNHFLFTRHIDVTLVSASLSHKRHVSNFGQCFMSGFKKKTFSLKANNSNFEQLCNAGCVIVEKRRLLLRRMYTFKNRNLGVNVRNHKDPNE